MARSSRAVVCTTGPSRPSRGPSAAAIPRNSWCWPTPARMPSRCARPVSMPPMSSTPKALQRVDTPGKTTVQAVAAHLGVPPQAVVKTLLFEVDGGVIGVLVRGDRQVNAAKLAKHLQAGELRLADRATVERVTGGAEGVSGAVGLHGV